jgi:hypothetical protein
MEASEINALVTLHVKPLEAVEFERRLAAHEQARGML